MLQLESLEIGSLWHQLLQRLYADGAQVNPREFGTREILNVTLKLQDSRSCILHHPARNLSYRFLLAEWLWIQYGRDDVATISQYNKNIAQFSDNGVDFNGSYGRPIRDQWDIVRDTLVRDPVTRQAVIYIFGTQRTRSSKDVPCTISLQFFWREGKLHTTAVMRSSDVWLGLPYDAHNFSMIGNVMAAEVRRLSGQDCEPGSLTMHLGSSHLYDRNLEDAQKVLAGGFTTTYRQPMLKEAPPQWLERVLVNRKGAFTEETAAPFEVPFSPWHEYSHVLCAQTNAEALEWITKIKHT